MLDKHDVERILKVSSGTVNNMMRRGQLPYVKIGKSVRFREDDIDRIMKGEGIKVNGEYQYDAKNE